MKRKQLVCQVLNKSLVIKLEHFRAMPLGRMQQLQQHEILKRIVGILQSVILSVKQDIIMIIMMENQSVLESHFHVSLEIM